MAKIDDHEQYNDTLNAAIDKLRAEENFEPYALENCCEDGGWSYDTCIRVLNCLSIEETMNVYDFVFNDEMHFTDEWRKALKDTIDHYHVEKAIFGE